MYEKAGAGIRDIVNTNHPHLPIVFLFSSVNVLWIFSMLIQYYFL